MGRERIDFRVEPEIMEELESIALTDGVSGRSAAVREAIYHYIDLRKDSWNSDAITVKLPKRLADKVGLFIKNGDAADVDQAIVLALDKWCNNLETYYLERRDELEHIVSENIHSDMTEKDLKNKVRKISKR